MRPWSRAASLALLLVSSSMVARPARSQEEGLELDPRVVWLTERIDKLVEERQSSLEGARVGIAVMDLSSGILLYDRSADELFNSASNTKIATTAAALALLGPDFRYRAGLYAERVDDDGTIPGDLYLRGRGDPSFGSESLYELARDLANVGVARVRGNIVIDSTYFDDEVLPPHFDEQPDEQASFRAPIGATSLNFNMVTIRVRPARSGAGPATAFADPPNDYIRVEEAIETVRRGRTRLRVESEESRNHLEVKVRGQIRHDSRERWFRFRIPNPVQYVGSALRAALATHNVAMPKKAIKEGAIPDHAIALALRDSRPLAVLVRGLGKYSNNYVAEMVLKTIGAETKDHEEPARWEDGLAAVRTFLEQQVGLEPGSFWYGNGSGLFDSNRFSPRQLVEILASAHRDYRYGPDLIASLSIAAADGTLSTRMAEGPAERQVRAKTGTLEGVSALSGYVAIDGRLPLAFSILVNHFPESRVGSARSLQDNVAEALVQYQQSVE